MFSAQGNKKDSAGLQLTRKPNLRKTSASNERKLKDLEHKSSPSCDQSTPLQTSDRLQNLLASYNAKRTSKTLPEAPAASFDGEAPIKENPHRLHMLLAKYNRKRKSEPQDLEGTFPEPAPKEVNPSPEPIKNNNRLRLHTLLAKYNQKRSSDPQELERAYPEEVPEEVAPSPEPIKDDNRPHTLLAKYNRKRNLEPQDMEQALPEQVPEEVTPTPEPNKDDHRLRLNMLLANYNRKRTSEPLEPATSQPSDPFSQYLRELYATHAPPSRKELPKKASEKINQSPEPIKDDNKLITLLGKYNRRRISDPEDLEKFLLGEAPEEVAESQKSIKNESNVASASPNHSADKVSRLRSMLSNYEKNRKSNNRIQTDDDLLITNDMVTEPTISPPTRTSSNRLQEMIAAYEWRRKSRNMPRDQNLPESVSMEEISPTSSEDKFTKLRNRINEYERRRRLQLDNMVEGKEAVDGEDYIVFYVMGKDYSTNPTK